MNYIKPSETKGLIPLNEENAHLADSFTRIPIPGDERGGDEVFYYLVNPENLTKAQYNKYLLKQNEE